VSGRLSEHDAPSQEGKEMILSLSHR